MHKINFDLSFLDDDSGNRRLKMESLSGDDERSKIYNRSNLPSNPSTQDSEGESNISGFVILIIIICMMAMCSK